MSAKKTTPKFSLWHLEHLSPFYVMAVKFKDTNSCREVEAWHNKSWYHAASLYRPEDEVNAQYLQTFSID